MKSHSTNDPGQPAHAHGSCSFRDGKLPLPVTPEEVTQALTRDLRDIRLLQRYHKQPRPYRR